MVTIERKSQVDFRILSRPIRNNSTKRKVFPCVHFDCQGVICLTHTHIAFITGRLRVRIIVWAGISLYTRGVVCRLSSTIYKDWAPAGLLHAGSSTPIYTITYIYNIVPKWSQRAKQLCTVLNHSHTHSLQKHIRGSSFASGVHNIGSESYINCAGTATNPFVRQYSIVLLLNYSETCL